MVIPYKRILGIDASTVNIGWAIIDYETEYMIKFGHVSYDSSRTSFYQRLRQGPKTLFQQVPLLDIDMIAIEHSFFTKNPSTGKAITMMIGAILFEGLNRGIEKARELSPTEIKAAYANDRWAIKQEIISFALFEYSVNLTEDEADAVATARAFIKLDKTGVFEKRRLAKMEKTYNAAQKRAKVAAGKKKKNLDGELNLFS